MEKRFKGLFHISSRSLIILLTFYFAFALNWKFWSTIVKAIEITNFRIFIFCLSLPIAFCLLYFAFFSLVVIPRIAKPLISFLLITASMANYAMYYFGIHIDKHMMQNVFETNTREAITLITFPAILHVLILGVMPAILLCLYKIDYKNFKQEFKWRGVTTIGSLIFIAILGAISFKEFVVYGRNLGQLRNQVNVVNYVRSTFRCISVIKKSHEPFQILDENVKFVKKSNRNVPKVLVMLVGEAARAKNFSLAGYERETNPYLKKQDIIFFKNVSSCGTATAQSVPCMFSNLKRENLDVPKAKNSENVLDLIQKAGYDVIWKENDDGCKGVCARLSTVEDMVKKQDARFCKKDYCIDEVFLDEIDTLFKAGFKKDTVIILHTMGSHGPTYFARYPENFSKFKPTCDTSSIEKCSTQEIINTYDNTISYTDYIISSVIDIIKKYPTYDSGVWYVSDHGESLGENNLYLHGMPYNIAPKEQTQIPMIMWLSDTMKKADNIDYECLKKISNEKEFSHDNIFSSMLGIAEVKTKLYEENYDIFNLCKGK